MMLKLPAALLAVWTVLLLATAGVCLTGSVLPSGQGMSLDRAAFTAANAATLTGFRQSIADVGQYQIGGQIAAFVAMLGGIALAWTVGGAAVGRLVGFPIRTAPLLGWTAAGLAILAVLSAAVGGWADAFSAVAAFGNCGLGLEPGRAADSIGVQVLLLIAAIGGVGPVVLIGLFQGGGRRYALGAVAATGVVYLVGTAVLFGCSFDGAMPHAARGAFVEASAGSLGARTMGTDLGLVGRSRSADWQTLTLITIGAGPGGTGVGIGPVTLGLLGIGLIAALRGRPTPPELRRVVGVAGLWLTMYLALAVVGQGMLLALQPQLPGDRALFLTVGALSNVGLSHDPINAVGKGLWTLTTLMLIGRLTPLALLTWAAAGVGKKQAERGGFEPPIQ